MLSCPWCQSKHIHRSRRKGIIERRILAMLFVRPFRCEGCDNRFFRWSIPANPNSLVNTTVNRPIGSNE